MRGKVQRSLSKSLQRREEAKNRKVERSFAGELSCVDSISKIRVSRWTRKSIRRFLTRSREATLRILFAYARLQIRSRDSFRFIAAIIFPRHWVNHPRAFCGFFPNSKFAVFQDRHLNSMRFSWTLRREKKSFITLSISIYPIKKLNSISFENSKDIPFTTISFRFLRMLILILFN